MQGVHGPVGGVRMVKNIFRWALTIVLVAGFAAKAAHDYHWARLRVVNSLMVSLEYKDLLVLEQPDGKLKDYQLKHFKSYFEQVALLMPGQADAYAMAGFCSYYLGQRTKALKAYQKAIAINPEFLWFYYDAGMICFMQEDYAKASEYFQKALLTRPQINAVIISQSKIFLDILRQAPQPVDIPERLKQGYEMSAYFVRLSAFLAQNPSSQRPDLTQTARLRIF